MRPDAARFIPPAAKGWRHPDEKLWNFHVQTNAGRGFPTKYATTKGGQGFVAQLARLQARHDLLRRAFVELKQQRQRERALERAEAQRLKRRYDAAWDKFIAAFNRHWDTCRKALHPSHFDPSQPRVPAGNPDGGQWTRVAGADKPRFGRGTIAAVLAEAAKRAIEAYRRGNSLWDLFGGKIGTVAVTTIDGQQVFGSNSTSPTYEAADHAAALELRDKVD